MVGVAAADVCGGRRQGNDQGVLERLALVTTRPASATSRCGWCVRRDCLPFVLGVPLALFYTWSTCTLFCPLPSLISLVSTALSVCFWLGLLCLSMCTCLSFFFSFSIFPSCSPFMGHTFSLVRSSVLTGVRSMVSNFPDTAAAGAALRTLFAHPLEPYSLDPAWRTATTLTFSTCPRRLHTLSRYPRTRSSWCQECRLGQPLHRILVRRYVHDGNARHLA